MGYVLFLGLTRVGGIFPTFEDAKQLAQAKGIWSICQIEPIDGKIKIVSRETFSVN